MKLRWRAAGDTHVGRVRKGNEDAFLADHERGVFLVADGMGDGAGSAIVGVWITWWLFARSSAFEAPSSRKARLMSQTLSGS